MIRTAPSIEPGTLIGYICSADERDTEIDLTYAYLPSGTYLSKEDHGRGKVLATGNLVLVDASRQYRHWSGYTKPEDYQGKMQQMVLVLPDGTLYVAQDIDGYGTAMWVSFQDGGTILDDVP